MKAHKSLTRGIVPPSCQLSRKNIKGMAQHRRKMFQNCCFMGNAHFSYNRLFRFCKLYTESTSLFVPVPGLYFSLCTHRLWQDILEYGRTYLVEILTGQRTVQAILRCCPSQTWIQCPKAAVLTTVPLCCLIIRLIMPRNVAFREIPDASCAELNPGAFHC